MKKLKIILIIVLSVFSAINLITLLISLNSSSWIYNTDGEFINIDISSNGEYIVAGSASPLDEYPEYGYVYLFHRSSPVPLWSFRTNDRVSNVAISADGNYIAASLRAQRFYVFERSNSTPLWEFVWGQPGLIIQSIAMSSDGLNVAVADGDRLFLFNILSPVPIWNASSLNSPSCIAFSSNGKYLAVGGANGDVYFLNISSPVPMWDYYVFGLVNSIAISGNGSNVAVGVSQDEKLYVFEKESNIPIWYYDIAAEVTSVDISENGKYIIAGGNNDRIYFFDVSSSEPLWTYLTNGEIYSTSIDSDGNYMNAWNWDHQFLIFHRTSSMPIWSFQGTESSYIGAQLHLACSTSSNGRYMGFISDKIYFIDRLNPTIVENIFVPILLNLTLLGIEFAISISVYYGINYYQSYRKRKLEEFKKENEMFDVLESEYEKWKRNEEKKS